MSSACRRALPAQETLASLDEDRVLSRPSAPAASRGSLPADLGAHPLPPGPTVPVSGTRPHPGVHSDGSLQVQSELTCTQYPLLGTIASRSLTPTGAPGE